MLTGIAALLTLGELRLVAAEPVRVEIQRTNGQVQLTWPSGLDLVQPQRRTNLTEGVWEDFGAPISSTNVTDPAPTATVFYQLRFLAPSVVTGPMGQTNAVGSNATFSVTATGTAPLAYQWQKGVTNLNGQTAANLSLMNLTTNDAGGYRVVITNRAGAVTSIVATLTVTNPAARPAGIYMGEFAGPADAGGFAILLRSNGLAYAVGYNTAQDEGVLAEGFTVANDGSFTTVTALGGQISGVFTTNMVAGNFTNSLGSPGTFSGNRKADTGIHAANAGYYSGLFTNDYQTVTVGIARAVMAADGTIFFYSSDPGGDGGGYGTVSAANVLTGTTVPVAFTLSGTLNPATKVISGTYSFGALPVGRFSINRTFTP